MCVCVCIRACVCVHACVCACVCLASVRMYLSMEGFCRDSHHKLLATSKSPILVLSIATELIIVGCTYNQQINTETSLLQKLTKQTS